MSEFRCAIEYRSDETRQSPGRIVGTLIRYGERAGDRPETFAPGALSWPDRGVPLRRQHDRQQPIVQIVPRIEGNAVIVDQPLLEPISKSFKQYQQGCELHEAQEVVRIVLPARHNTALPLEPGEKALDLPPPRVAT